MIDCIGLREELPVNLLFGEILERILEKSPHALIHLGNNSQGPMDGSSRKVEPV